MNLPDTLILFVVMATLALVPSTGVALVIARASTAGFAHGAAVAAGIVLGDLLFVFLAVFGMAALAEAAAGFFLLLRYAAGAYLIWFGVRLLRTRPRLPTARLPADARGHAASGLGAGFLSGLLITLGDVKAIFFYASLFPTLIDLATLEASGVATIVAVTLVAVGGVKLGYAYAARRVTSLARGLKREREARVAAGGLLLTAGAYLIVKT